MNNTEPLLIIETNLSRAWATAFLHIIDNPGKEISPLVVSLTGFTNGIPEEDEDIQKALDNSLIANHKQKIHTVANTIFPDSYWRKSKQNRQNLFDRYIKALPRIKVLASSKNCRGTYFERLIAFGACPKNGAGPENGINQLEYIIYQYKLRKNVRKSMLQASIFDPAQDHIPNAQIPFPCLQHVSFVPNNTDKTLTINAFYATQQIFEKAYGNYLGLCRLGAFMAHEMGLTLARMNCFVGVAKIDTIKKSDDSLTSLKNVSRKAIQPKTNQQRADGISHEN